MPGCKLAVFLIVVLAAAPHDLVFAADPTSRPNVILVLADDLGYGDLACYGHPRFKTPHLDRMAAEGARLTQFYANCPYCAPTRAGLMTGRYQFRSNMTRNPFPTADLGGNRASDHLGVPAGEVTLGEAFLAAGYRTAHVGKWHLGHRPEFFPTRHGFQQYFGISGGPKARDGLSRCKATSSC